LIELQQSLHTNLYVFAGERNQKKVHQGLLKPNEEDLLSATWSCALDPKLLTDGKQILHQLKRSILGCERPTRIHTMAEAHLRTKAVRIRRGTFVTNLPSGKPESKISGMMHNINEISGKLKSLIEIIPPKYVA
jgi:hypothetical protein